MSITTSLDEILKGIIRALDRQGIDVQAKDGVRIVGSTASSLVLGTPQSQINDIDLSLFLGSAVDFRNVLKAQERALIRLIFDKTGRTFSPREVFDQFFFLESLLVNTAEDCWSLISIGSSTFSVDIKVVYECSRSYAFSVDSFEVILYDFCSYFEKFPALESDSAASDHSSFEVRSSYGNYVEALLHLLSRRLCTDNPEKIHRGFFRYCLELAKGGFVVPVDAQTFSNVFSQSFFNEFGSHPASHFSLALDKFLEKHNHHRSGILMHMYYLLSATMHSRTNDFLGVVFSRLYFR